MTRQWTASSQLFTLRSWAPQTNRSNFTCFGTDLVLPSPTVESQKRPLLLMNKLCLWRPALCCRLLKTLHAQLVYTEDHVDTSQRDGAHALPTDGPSSERLIFQFKPQNRRKLHKSLALYKHQLNEILLGEGKQIKPEQVAAGQTFEDLEAWLYKRGWDLRSGDVEDGEVVSADSSDDDDPPVVVELDEDGREVGLVSFAHD